MKTLLTKQNAIVSLNIIFCLILILLRVKYTQSITYMFLIWNLFLAGIPYVISQILKVSDWIKNNNLILLITISFWLLFLPNAPYIITDLIHLNHINSTIIWFDAFLIFFFALNGLGLAILSMIDVYIVLQKKWNQTIAIICTLLFSILSGFGIYLGRYLRWNSWELFTQPNHLLKDVFISLQNSKAIFVTICMSGLLMLLFSSYLYLFHKKEPL